MPPRSNASAPASRHFAVVGAGMAGVVCARTLMQAGHRVSVFEKCDVAGGRMASYPSPFGSFDAGAQYFTVRDARFATALATVPTLCRPWAANAVRVLDALGRVAEAALPTHEEHWVGQPGMDALVRAWAEPIARAGELHAATRIARIEPDTLDRSRWQLHAEGPDDTPQVRSGFDAVLLATPSATSYELLSEGGLTPDFCAALQGVRVAPCWTLLLAFPQAVQPSVTHIGPQWNAARSTHHRAAWLARESSKPGRGRIERWTLQASPAWSAEHADDDPARVEAKLLRAFAEITGIRAEPGWVRAVRWRQAQTISPLDKPYLWDKRARLGLAGDWCLGHRVEDAFVSGLELALAVI